MYNCIPNRRFREQGDYCYQKYRIEYLSSSNNWLEQIKFYLKLQIKIKDVYFKYLDKIDKYVLFNECTQKFLKKEITEEKYSELLKLRA